MFGIPSDKAYIVIVGIVVFLGVIGFLASSHIKSCVKNEVNSIQEVTKKKKKIMLRKMQEQQRQQQQIQQRQQQIQLEEEQEQEDMGSYVDPVKHEGVGVEGFNSDDFQGQAYNNENVLMRDLISRPNPPQ